LQRGLGLFTRATNLPQTTRALRWCDPSTVNRQPMRIALAQINPTSGDIRHNTERILDALTAARRERADLVVVPEMALPGYCIGDLVEDAGFLDANERAMQEIAQAARGITAVVGFIDFDPAARNDNGTIRKYNAAAVVRDGNVLQRARKSLLPNYRYFDDKRFFTPGERRDPIDVAVGSTCARIGVSICEAMWDEFYEIKPLPELELPRDDRVRELHDALVMTLRDYMRKTGFTRAIVPVSGGIDSALALALTVDALGADRVLAYNLPSRYNSETTRGIAARLAGAFGVRYGTVPIQEIDEKVRSVFEGCAHPIAQNLTRENLHARIRGLLMMAESNDTGALLISCGNETEIALGYATLYGDMCGGISLIGDLSKMDVYSVARYVNSMHGREMIPEDTFHIKPSAELAAGQCDPFDYAVVSPIVGEFAEHRTSPADLIRLFEQHALDPTRFGPDAQGLTVYDKYTRETFRTIA